MNAGTKLTVTYALSLVGIFIFMVGYLRHEPSIQYEEQDYLPLRHAEHLPKKPPFDRIVFMVVDALRSDFVYSHGSGFENTQSLIRKGVAVPFTAFASPPTLTFPRIKALTAGINPSFIDLFIDVAGSGFIPNFESEATWLKRLYDQNDGRKLIQYGEITWSQLFPTLFERIETTHPVNVMDIKEVDQNVTHHATEELKKDDWKAMILHFPGLDHIGHTGGPRSPYMFAKQREMDDVILKIFQSLQSYSHLRRTLLVVCGDHGMHEEGDHGGSSPGETSSALMFISPTLKTLTSGFPCPVEPVYKDFTFYSKVDQSDVVATLAGLLGFNIPRRSLGVFIEDFLPLWKDSTHRIRLLQHNAAQLMQNYMVSRSFLRTSNHPYDYRCDDASLEYEELSFLYEQAQEAAKGETLDSAAAAAALLQFCRKAQKLMSLPVIRLHLPLLLVGVGVMLASLAITATMIQHRAPRPSLNDMLPLTILLVYGLSIVNPDLVINEHLIWYPAISAWFSSMAFINTTNKSIHSILTIVLLVLTLSWNSTIDAQTADLGAIQSILSNHNMVLWLFVTITIGSSAYQLRKQLQNVLLPTSSLGSIVLAGFIATFLALAKSRMTLEHSPNYFETCPKIMSDFLANVDYHYCFRLMNTGLLIVFVFLPFRARWASDPNIRRGCLLSILELGNLYLIAQTRVHNIPLLLIFRAQLHCIISISREWSPSQLTCTTILLANTSYFVFGGSNSIASIDFTNSYNALNTWHPIYLPIQLFVANRVGPVWWTCANMYLLLCMRESDGDASSESSVSEPADIATRKTIDGRSPIVSSVLKSSDLFAAHLTRVTFFRTWVALTIMLAIFWHRNDARRLDEYVPRYLYMVVWHIVEYVFIEVFFCGILWRVIS